jgi:hypothetical protein
METNFSTAQEVPEQPFVQNQADNTKVKVDEICLNPSKSEIEANKNGKNESALYTPHWIVGGAKHPGLILETPGLGCVTPPPITYRPHLPRNLSEESLISAFQFERIIYAGQAHEQRLGNGARAGISIGDGTGAGKTTTLAGLILDNWFRGRRKTVWFSVKADLIEAVREEFERIGFKIPIWVSAT